MPVINRIAELHDEITAWRHDFHAHPELRYEVHRTAARVAELLKTFGADEVVTGIGRTGVVGIIEGQKGAGPTIGLRADMDALPLNERTGKPYTSSNAGAMHACGHDGHTAMLLGAAKYLAETRNFAGRVAVIFQPAEEGGAGGLAMVEDGLMDRFAISEVYGLHNFPGIAAGHFSIRVGGIMAATDEFTITVVGVGGHAAIPHDATDPVITAAHLITGLQTLVSRNLDPNHSAVLSVTMLKAGDVFNVIPRTAQFTGTIRTLDESVRDMMEERLRSFVTASAKAFGCDVEIDYKRGYPVTINTQAEVERAVRAASEVVGADRVEADGAPSLGAEDFSYMLQARQGAYIMLGQGTGPSLHDDSYDFNDAIIPVGASYWARLVETILAPA